MAIKRRSDRVKQEFLWVATTDLPMGASHPFYRKLNEILDSEKFDEFVEGLSEKFYAGTVGRPGLAPGIYFRALLVGYFEGIDSERGIAWRASDSLSIRKFLRISLDEGVPDHSTVSRTRRLIDVETHQAVFQWVLEILAKRKLLKGDVIGVDATTLEANAALKSIVRRDSGEKYDDFLKRLAKESGIETPTREQLAALDKERKKKGSNKDWTNPHDPEARITKMKDGRTHLAYKAEHAVDMETEAIVAVKVYGADQGDTKTILPTILEAMERISDTASASNDLAGEEVVNPAGPDAVVTDKGYHSKEVVRDLVAADVRTYVSEPSRGRQKWVGQTEEQQAVYANRRRIRGETGKCWLRQRGEKLERWNQHLYDRGGMRRVHLRGKENILKRLIIHAGAANLGLVMRQLSGIGTPKGLQGLSFALIALTTTLWSLLTRLFRPSSTAWAESRCLGLMQSHIASSACSQKSPSFATGC